MAAPSAFSRMMEAAKSKNSSNPQNLLAARKTQRRKRADSMESSDEAESAPQSKKTKTGINKHSVNEPEFIKGDHAGTLKTNPIVLKLNLDVQKAEKPKPSEDRGVYDLDTDNERDYVPPTSPLAAIDKIGVLFSHRLSIKLTDIYTHDMYRKDSRRGETKTSNNSASVKTHLDTTKPPLYSIHDIFDVIAKKLNDLDFQKACNPFKEQGLRVVTMCSGTESPLLAMDLIQDAFNRLGDSPLHVEHLASAEIEPFKQAYIQRNFEPKILFRDVTEFSTREEPHTAFGGTAKQPENVHLLIAGSSCIDYSLLNNKRKVFGEDGQSKATMDGILAYAERFSPAVVILENVNTAPWEEIRDLWDSKGYFGVVIHLDTKDFYIPQTRNRGYMIAFNRKKATAVGIDLKAAASTMIKSMLALAQRASAPFSDFIYSDDDKELKLVKKAYNASSASRDIIDWKACRLRYANYRIENKLGVQRPMTRWRNGGKSQYLDYAWMGWSRLQRERIHDTIDIDYLHYLSWRHYDMTYKARVIELSQNVDRARDGRQWGIIGCITPSGQPFDTRRGGPISGREALSLQGLPIDELSLNNETSRQLQDLAGNAMSTTTVGCVIFSAILASYAMDASQTSITSIFEKFQSLPVTNTQSLKRMQPGTALTVYEILQQPGSTHLEKQEFRFCQGAAKVTVTGLKDLAQSTLSLCGCDNLGDRSSMTFVICKQCRHTVCSGCAGNPIHEYTSLKTNDIGAREEPEAFTRFVARSLPPFHRIDMLPDAITLLQNTLRSARDCQDHIPKPDDPSSRLLQTADADKYIDAIVAALNTTVYFQTAKQESLWRVIYESRTARLELHIYVDGASAEIQDVFSNTASMRCLWLLYAKASPDEPAASPVRDLLARPVARMQPAGEDLFQGTWQLWNPSMEYGYLEIRGAGRRQPSWEQKLGLQNNYFRKLDVFPILSIRASRLANKTLSVPAWDLLNSLCGTYEWHKNCGTACGSLYGRVSDETSDDRPAYLFLDPKPHQDAYLDRMVFADSHHRLPYGVSRQIAAELPKSWRPFKLHADSEDGTCIPESVLCRIVSVWVDTDLVGFGMGPKKQDLTLWTCPDPALQITDCKDSTSVFVCSLPSNNIQQSLWKSGNSYPIPLANRPGALKNFQALIKRMSQQLALSGIYYLPLGADVECKTCAPAAPVLAWGNTRQGTGKRIILKPFEDPKEATAYEKAVTGRPLPITADVHVHDDAAYLVVKLNLAAAVHRLQKKALLTAHSGELRWHLVHNDGLESPPKFPPLTLYRDPTDFLLWPDVDTGYSTRSTALKPKLFKQRTLWISQRKTLGWMLDVEGGKPWQEWDAEVCIAPALGIELRVEAFLDVKISGGIIADEVGAGKTTTSLALIARGLEDAQKNRPAAKVRNGRIVSTATLILVPAPILQQWSGEIDSCFGPNQLKVVILKSKGNTWNIDSLKTADIILAPWNIFSGDEYWQTISDICCAPFIPRKAGRAFKQWLDGATEDLESIVEHCGSNLDKASFNSFRQKSKDAKAKKYFRFQAFQEKNAQAKTKTQLAQEAQKMMPGSATPDALKEDEKAARQEFNNLCKWKAGKTVPAVLHFFDFQRIIVDEFTYLDARALTAVQSLRTKHPWMLSGTPPLNNAETINSMAMLLNTKVFGYDEAAFQFSFKDSRTASVTEKSYAEEFREQTEQRALSWIQRRNERAAEFVDILIRQNPAPPITAKKLEHFMVSSQSVLEMCIYDKSYQRIMGQPLKFGGTKTTAKMRADMPADFTRILEQAHGPEEALLSCHAYFLKDYMKDHAGETDEQICDALIEEQQKEVRVSVDVITSDLKEAFWYWLRGPAKDDGEQDNMHFVTFLYCILIGSFGDPLVCNLMNRLAVYARNRTLQQTSDDDSDVSMDDQKLSQDEETPEPSGLSDYDDGPDDEDEVSTRVFSAVRPRGQKSGTTVASKKVNLAGRRAELLKLATKLNEKVTFLVEQVQHLRLLQSISTVIRGKPEYPCHACDSVAPVEKLLLLGNCGHLVCEACLAAEREGQAADSSTCPVEICSASAKNCSTPARAYAESTSTMTTAHGSKIESIILTLNSLDKDDNVIIFVQFKAHKDQLIRALESAGLHVYDGAKESRVKQYQDAVGAKRHILVLEIDSTDSAGWNLQQANHVMFFASFLSKTQYDFDATMTQAVGRAHRFGQLKDVHVYHFLSARTMDVNIIQARRGGRLVKVRSGN